MSWFRTCAKQVHSMARTAAFLLALSSLAAVCQALHPDFAASISETGTERRRRLKVEGVLPADPAQGLGVGQIPEQDGIAVGLDGKVYSDTAITEAVAQVGQLGPLNPKVAICHFPPQERSQFQVKYLEVIPLVAAQLIKKGDFLAPSYPNHKYGYGCILYDHVCDFSTEEPCNLQGTCQTNNTCFCDNDYTTCLPLDDTNGCETVTGTDPNNCGNCGNICPNGSPTCCAGLCTNLNTSATNCGACAFACTSIPDVQTANCVGGLCNVQCATPALFPCFTNAGPLCINNLTDPNFCGSCTTTCPKDPGGHGTRICTNGTCGINCNANFPTQCGNPPTGASNCVNLKSSITNCGACGKKCPTDPNAITICNLGTCLFTCTGGLTQCGTALAPTCVDTTSDNANCGSCGFVCQQSFSCVSSVCTNVNAG